MELIENEVLGEPIYYAHHLSPELKQLWLAPLSDVHYGNRLFSIRHFLKTKEFIEKTDYVFTIINGDLIESTLRSSRGDIFRQVGTPQNQRDWAIEQLYPIRAKILGMTMGNHEKRIFNEVGIDICADIAKALNIPYRPEGIIIKISFGEGNEGHMERPYSYFIAATHGYGGARTKSAKAVKVERLATWIHADCYCLHPHTKVLRGNLVWDELGNIRVGDELIGVSEYPEFNQARQVIHTQVTDVKHRMSDTLEIILEDGTKFVATPDHLWLNKRRPDGNKLGGRYHWYRTNKLQIGDKLLQVFPVWETKNDWVSGYIAGLLDGEGSITVGGRRTRVMTFSQKEGEVMNFFEEYLRSKGISYRKYGESPQSSASSLVITIDGSRLIGAVQPIRLRGKARFFVEKRLHKPRTLKIISITPRQREEVITIETDRHTFLAEGLATHNCMSHDHVANAAPDVYLMPDPRTHIDKVTGFEIGRVQAHRKVLVKTNAYLKWGDYSEMFGFPPVDLETPIIKFAGQGKPKVKVEI